MFISIGVCAEMESQRRQVKKCRSRSFSVDVESLRGVATVVLNLFHHRIASDYSDVDYEISKTERQE